MQSIVFTIFTIVMALVLAVAPNHKVQAQEFEKNILTGGPNGTYIQIGRDLAAVASNCGLNYAVQESAGSLENFLGVRKRRHTQLGIVQSDVLEYLNTFSSEDPDIARAIFGVRIAFPLYNEEVHILASRDLASLVDLNGRRVAVGVEDSGTFLTASLVLDLANVQPAERVTINATESLQSLLAGEIDAFFYVAGAPTKLFQSEEIDAARFHLLPINDPTLSSVYVPTSIPAGTYKFQTEATEVVAVKAVLMTYDYSPTRNAYHRESCKSVSDLSKLILTNFSQLQEVGHPKWRSVDLNDIPPGWDIGNCVNAGLQENYELKCAAQTTTPVAVAAETLESKANAAYRERICASIGC
ncbi:MAG: TAXI family TRAP transporter solute-binding subunit [Paracoccaceae bacterium]